MPYFSNFPLVYYDLSNSSYPQPIVVRNIMARVKIRDMIKNNTYVYYTYDVKPSDTPEIIAHKYYGDAEKHWIILLANDMVDARYDWPLFGTDFLNYIINKYGSLNTAQSTIHHYEKNIVKTDIVTGIITSFDYIIDLTTYNNLPANQSYTLSFPDGHSVNVSITKSAVDCFSYEDEVNQNKQTIKVIDNSFVSQLEKELTQLLQS